MKKITILCALFMMIAFISFAQNESTTEENNVEQAESADGPTMTFEQKVIDYGEIEENSDPFRYFKFSNTGSEPLLITSAKGSCGCTVPTYPTEAIAPGEEGEIKVRYATNRIGKFQKTVTLTTNMKDPKVVLTIKGDVHKKPEQPDGVPSGEKNLFKSGGRL